MDRKIEIQARWDGEASLWLATSTDVPGLVVEADSWPEMIEEVRLVLPDLLELSNAVNPAQSITLKFDRHPEVRARTSG